MLKRTVRRLPNGDVVFYVSTDNGKLNHRIHLSRDDVEFLWHKSNPPTHCFWEENGICVLTNKPCNADPKTLCDGFVNAESKKQEEKT